MKTKALFLILTIISCITFQSCNDSDDTNTIAWSCGDTISDVDGNTYNTVNIGGECWTVQNLNSSKYNDNIAITNITDQTEWVNSTDGSWSYYDNDATIGAVHGKLYNWFAVETGKLCPQGWHVPSINEWNALVNTLGGAATGGEAMKSIEGWDNSPDNASNSSGLTVLPSGNRDIFGGFLGLGQNVWFYTSTEDMDDPNKAHWLKVTSNIDTDQGTTFKKDGLPCRCVLD